MASESNPASDAAMLMPPPPAPAPASSIINALTCAATTNITKLRSHIAKEMDKEFVTADFDAFLAAYLSFVPRDTDVDACFKRMCQGSGNNNQPLITTIPAAKTNAKEAKKKTTPRLSFHFAAQVEHPGRNTEKKVFAQLVPIAEAIGNSRISGRNKQYRLFDCPDTTIASDIGGSTNKIDACFVPDGYKKEERLHTSKIAVACEWKIRDNEMAKNNVQVVSANVQMTNCDVCRMYSFGITIDGCVMKLWYFSRSHSAVSEPVNYIDNPKFLIKAFMSFMFASPKEMGFDPSITRHPNGDFTYTVSGRHFRTVKCISELRSNNISGRRTRVWSVNEVKSTAQRARLMSKHEYVLKDAWLEETALTETEMQTAIFNDIERFWNTTDKTSKDRDKFEDLFKRHEKLVTSGEYKKHFLTIETDSIQQVTKEAVSKTRKLGLFTATKNTSALDTIATRSSKKDSKLSERVIAHVDLEGIHPVQLDRRNKILEREFARRKQYRVVFKEKCETVGRLDTLGEVFDVVKDTLIPLQLMFCAGWVHRDISSGNILAYKPTSSSQWIAKLSDLEYAKRFPPIEGVTHHKDPKTGTPFFMATEILLQQYLFEDLTQAVKISLDVTEATKSKSYRIPVEKLTYTPIIHNFQHDLECLWWFLFWSMTSRVNHQASQQYADSIFDNSLVVSSSRVNALRYSIEDNLSKALIQPASALLPGFMDATRSLLYTNYRAREEQGRLFDSSSYIGIHALFPVLFEDLYEAEDTSWRAIKLQLPSNKVNNDTAGPSAPGMTQQLSTSRQQEADLGDAHKSTAGSSTRVAVEQPKSLGKGKRRESPSEDSEAQSGPGPKVALEEDRPSKRLRLTTRKK